MVRSICVPSDSADPASHQSSEAAEPEPILMNLQMELVVLTMSNDAFGA